MKKLEMIHLKIDNKAYAKAYKEVLEIIKYFPEEEYNKIIVLIILLLMYKEKKLTKY